jgi:hypothetical protein
VASVKPHLTVQQQQRVAQGARLFLDSLPSQLRAVPQLQLVKASTTSATLPLVVGLPAAGHSTPCLIDHPSRGTTATLGPPLQQLERRTTCPSLYHRLLRVRARASTLPRNTTPTPLPTSPRWSSSKPRMTISANACERLSELYVLADVTAVLVRLTAAHQILR